MTPAGFTIRVSTLLVKDLLLELVKSVNYPKTVIKLFVPPYSAWNGSQLSPIIEEKCIKAELVFYFLN